MPSSKYHKDQADLLAGLALTTDSPEKARQFNLAAMEHLEQAQVVDDPAPGSDDAPPGSDQAQSSGEMQDPTGPRDPGER